MNLESKTTTPDQDSQAHGDSDADPTTSTALGGQLIAQETDKDGSADGTETDQECIQGSSAAVEALCVQSSLLYGNVQQCTGSAADPTHVRAEEVRGKEHWQQHNNAPVLEGSSETEKLLLDGGLVGEGD